MNRWGAHGVSVQQLHAQFSAALLCVSDHTEVEQSMEGHTPVSNTHTNTHVWPVSLIKVFKILLQVSENPHAEYGLTDNIQVKHTQTHTALCLMWSLPQTPSMLFCCSSEDGGEREGERREDVEAESGPAGAADPGVPGPDGGPDPAAGAVDARQGQVHTHTNRVGSLRPIRNMDMSTCSRTGVSCCVNNIYSYRLTYY